MRARHALGFIRAVSASITWRNLLTAWALGFAVFLVRQFQNGAHAPPNFPISGLVITNLGAMFVLLAALSADEAIRRGAPPWLAYLLSLMTASALTAVSQFYMRAWFHLYTSVNQPGVPIAVQRTHMIYVACDVMVFGGFAMLAFLNSRSSVRVLEGVRGAELRRVQLERQLTASRLAVTRARIDPGALFETLGEIRNLYALSAPQADLRMDELIQRLQATVTDNPVEGESRRALR
jgi:hypothetical protein